MAAWYLYMIECVGGSLYTGITVDVDKRFATHAAGKGGHYTRSHPPLRVMAVAEFPDRRSASSAEYRIKRLRIAGKREFCRQNPPRT